MNFGNVADPFCLAAFLCYIEFQGELVSRKRFVITFSSVVKTRLCVFYGHPSRTERFSIWQLSGLSKYTCLHKIDTALLSLLPNY